LELITESITAELKITPQAADFFNQILSFLAYGGSSIVKALLVVLVTRTSRKGIVLSDSISMVNWMDGLELLNG
jgi:hypothetical protein